MKFESIKEVASDTEVYLFYRVEVILRVENSTNPYGVEIFGCTSLRQNYNQRKQTSIDTEDRNFLGKTKELEAVLGLKSKRLTHKVPVGELRLLHSNHEEDAQ